MSKTFKSKLLIVALIVISMVATSTFVNAYSVGIALTSSSKLVEGETVTISVNLTSIDAGEDGIAGISATLDYDTDVFETATSSDFTTAKDWSITYVEVSKKMNVLRTSKTSSAENVMTITLKVKETIDMASTKVVLSGIKASGGLDTGDITVPSCSVTLSKDTAPVVVIEQVTNTTVQNTTTTPTTNTVKTTATTKLPYTGASMAIIAIIAVVAIVGTISFVLYKKTSKEVK